MHLPRFDALCRAPGIIAPSESQKDHFEHPVKAYQFFKDLLALESEKLKQVRVLSMLASAKCIMIDFFYFFFIFFYVSGERFSPDQA